MLDILALFLRVHGWGGDCGAVVEDVWGAEPDEDPLSCKPESHCAQKKGGHTQAA
jgi:hypothetical protein